MALSPSSSHGIRTGTSSPNGVITSANYGDLYCDTRNGALYVYVGDGDAAWICCGGDPDGSNLTDGGYPSGVSHGGSNTRLIASTGHRAVLSDAAAQANTGNGVYWNDTGAADGSQVFAVYTGSAAQYSAKQDTKGHLRPSTLVLTNHAAPADADLSAGDCALWFDQTNGAAKLMIKGKSANGTVVTGAVLLV